MAVDETRSAAIIAQIERLVVPEGHLACWALGQSGFVVKGGDALFVIDPYLSDAITANGGPVRNIAAPIDALHLLGVQHVFTTHEHQDHTDGATLSALLHASPAAQLITSPQGSAIAVAAGIAADRITTPQLGAVVALPYLSYTAIPAAHYPLEVDADGHARWMGYLITCNGVTLYHAGDTILIPEMLAALHDNAIDLAFLPINGRDYFREHDLDLTGNLWPREAVHFAQTLHAKVLIGMHNDLFQSNRVAPGLLFDEMDRFAPTQRTHILQPGELYYFVR